MSMVITMGYGEIYKPPAAMELELAMKPPSPFAITYPHTPHPPAPKELAYA